MASFIQLSLFAIPLSKNKARNLDELTVIDVATDLFPDRFSKQKIGMNYIGLCVFHKEKSPSLWLKPSKNFYICYSCKQYGGPLSLLFYFSNNPINYVYPLLEIKSPMQDLLNHVEKEETNYPSFLSPYWRRKLESK